MKRGIRQHAATLACGLVLGAAGIPVLANDAPPAPPAAGAASGFAPVLPGQPLAFPRDHGAHPDFRTEWWYVTGWLSDAEGVERGFQVTFFRIATGIGADNPSRFAPRQLIVGHAAIADPAQGRLLHAERSARALPPLAGADETRTASWIGDWTLHSAGEGYRTRIDAGEFDLALDLVPGGPPLLNGDAGYSRKAAPSEHASHYYSRPQLRAHGTLGLAGRRHAVQGRAWLDHEWSSTLMPPGARGWDWTGINLADGGSLMAFQMRATDGTPLWAAATLADAGGRSRTLTPEQVSWRPLRHWRSPRTGASYPVSWALTLALPEGVREFVLEPLMDDQELDGRRSTGAVYWEGAVRLRAAGPDGAEHGRGYLEMTGYADRLSL